MVSCYSRRVAWCISFSVFLVGPGHSWTTVDSFRVWFVATNGSSCRDRSNFHSRWFLLLLCEEVTKILSTNTHLLWPLIQNLFSLFLLQCCRWTAGATASVGCSVIFHAQSDWIINLNWIICLSIPKCLLSYARLAPVRDSHLWHVELWRSLTYRH